MTTNRITNLENEIDKTLEMTSICRGEWCRALESDVDRLEVQLQDVTADAKTFVAGARIEEMNGKIQHAYRNLGPDIHV